VKVYGHVLKIDENKISVEDNFFYLGGNSILVIKLINEINKIFNNELAVSIIFNNSTVRKLSQFILKNNNHDHIYAFNSKGNRTPLFFVHPGFGGSETYIELSEHINKNQRFYAIEFPYYDDNEKLTSINTLANIYIQHMKKIVPKGPYYLGGWSLGGVIAYEMARILEMHDEKVVKLYLLDPIFFNKDFNKDMKQSLIDIAITEEDEYLKKEIKNSPNYNKINSNEFKEYIYKNNLLSESMYKYRPKEYGGNVVLFKAKEDNTLSSLNLSKNNGLGNNVKSINIIRIDEFHSDMNKGKSVKIIADVINLG
jgi:thioesterase domain-containing protein